MAPKPKPEETEAEPRTRTPNPLRVAALDFAKWTDELASILVRKKRNTDERITLEGAEREAVKRAEAARKVLDATTAARMKEAAPKRERARKGQPDDQPPPAPRSKPKPGEDEEE